MILRNYHNVLAMLVLGCNGTNLNSYGQSVFTSPDEALFTKIGDTYFYGVKIASITFKGLNLGTPNAENPLRFGTGNTPVTYDDWQLAQDVTSSLGFTGFVNNDPTYDSATRTFTKIMSMVVTNNSANELTIREVGIQRSASSPNGGSSTIMYYREVLDEPFTLAPGESKLYSHKFRFTMPEIS